MIDILKEMCRKENYLSFYTDIEDTLSFHYGKILSVNKKHIVLYLISPGGLFDGILVIETWKIYRIEMDGQYKRKINKLCSFADLPVVDYTFDNEKIVNSIMKFALLNKTIISVELENSGFTDIIGFVDEINDDICKILQVDEYGCKDGFSYISINNITEVSCLSKHEKEIMSLMTNQEQKTENPGDGTVC